MRNIIVQSDRERELETLVRLQRLRIDDLTLYVNQASEKNRMYRAATTQALVKLEGCSEYNVLLAVQLLSQVIGLE